MHGLDHRVQGVSTSAPASPPRKSAGAGPRTICSIFSSRTRPFRRATSCSTPAASSTEIQERGKLPIVTGGTYFYLKALQYGMYPTPVIPSEVIEENRKRIFRGRALQHGADARRPRREGTRSPARRSTRTTATGWCGALAILRTTNELPSELKPVPFTDAQKDRIWMKYAMVIFRHALNTNIVNRTEKMLSDGLVEETRGLMEKYPAARALGSIGYLRSGRLSSKEADRKTAPERDNRKNPPARQAPDHVAALRRGDSFHRQPDEDRVKLEVDNLAFAIGD